ncbi:MAG: ABC transporter substrate-binding protein [Sulfobacillus acidophilus]|uniref:ABC transporter substrate-binding protein n=1 Tax=Sulfobacillus acidophilus TaxID=53633 RepID=A0A2T2WFN5_9FIRM|nr:MAG: ABC transporter substrate-binding protein [Sulfobacillus acidophilus]
MTRFRRLTALALMAPIALITTLSMAHFAVAAHRPNTTSHKVVHITYWAGHSSGALHAAVVAEVQKFNATHPGIQVTFHPIGASHHGLAAFEAGQAPNVGMLSEWIVPQLIQAGALIRLNTWVSGKGGLSAAQIKDDYYPVVWNDMKEPDGAQYLMPLEKKSLVVIYYNEHLFKKAGIAAPPKSWEQVGQDAEKITALGSQYHGIAWTPSLRQYFDIVTADGGDVFSTKTHRTHFALGNRPAENALAMLRTWIKKGWMIQTSGYQYQLDFGTGNVGMLIDASAGYTYDKASVGGKFVMGGVAAPVGTSGHPYQYINGASLAMFNVGTAAQKQASWTFVKYLSSPQTNVYWDEHTNYLPLGPQAYRMMEAFYKTHPAEAASFSNPRYWWYKPRNPNYEAAKAAMETPFDKALRGTLSPVNAATQMTQIGTQYLTGQIKG